MTTSKRSAVSTYQVRKSSKALSVIIWIFLALWAVINLFPLYWMFTFSLKDNDQILRSNRFGLPREWFWSNYSKAMKAGNILNYFKNSIIITLVAILITIMAAMMASYAMTRIEWRGSGAMNKIFMLGITIPIQASIIPVYLVLSKLELLDSYVALIVPYSAFSLTMAILICTGFMDQLPKDLDEAAYIDGCGRTRVFFSVIVPLMKPAVATTSIYTFLQCWNELMFAQTFNTKKEIMTLPAGIQQLTGSYTVEWGPIGAALTIATFPTIFVYILLSRRIQESFIAGAIKG
ncbi:MAG: carbohydrate ABC transporter permease [Lachnospiraceae bacterium]|nr:carbohydrate ABC transporter permease [Lachnospiraceae bacterium]